MAEQVAQDVVKEAQSTGEHSPVDDSAATTNPTPAGSGQAPQTSSETVEPEYAKASNDAVPAGSATEVDEERSATPATAGEGVDALLRLPNDEAAASFAIADLSGGSDTDTSRPDGFELGKGNQGHVRSDSIKKPTTFKAVSHTKSFLAKTTTPSPAPKGAELRGSPSVVANAAAQSSARPRLVAKSVSGNLGSKLNLAKGGAASGAPDASKVWNKNQPVAPTPAKQLTDEELKQQYGIHMATRLQADEGGKESKWADIDDDEDDWVPDSVEWMDGTKSSVMAVEAVPTAQESIKAASDALPSQPPVPLVAPVLVQRPSSTSGTKTILKPGAHTLASPSQQRAANGLVFKGAAEKPTLVAKSPAATPVKSPWAALPPVDKVPLVAPPVQPPTQSRFTHQDPHGFGSLPPITAAREIAADDFSRREEQSNRTLFDSKSGRYEPVNDARRNSIRDHGYRQPAVLQRPSGDHPAEPSAAFQTSRSGLEGSWSRRRASSSLSGGSGALARRMSIGRSIDGSGPPHDLNQQRRESSSFNGSGVSPVDQFRSGQSQDARTANGLPTARWSRTAPVDNQLREPADNLQQAASNADQQIQPEGTPTESSEDPVARQQRLMKEKLDRARAAKQREIEKEKEEAAARVERLRLKMASLAPPSPAPTASETVVVGNANEPIAEAKQQPVQPPEQPSQQSVEHLSPSKTTAAPKPQIPTSNGETTQFGLIKLHPSQSPRKSQQEPGFGTRPFQNQHQRSLQEPLEGLRAPNRGMHAPMISPPKPDALVMDSAVPGSSRAESVEGSFSRKQEVEGGWSQNKVQQTSTIGNIWGAGFATLGNGTFNNPSQQQLQAGEAPVRPQKKPQQDVRTGRHFAGGRYVPASGAAEGSQAGINAWTQFRQDLPEMQKAEAEKQLQQLEQLKQSGYSTSARVQVTHKKTDPDTGMVLGENSNTARNDNVVHAAQPLSGLPNGTAVTSGPGNLMGSLAPAGVPSRSSLNRAVGAERTHGSQTGAVKPASKFADFFGPRVGSNSPPPPDALNHELLDGNPRTPGVKLPAPKPQVRLPSAASGGPAIPPSATQARSAQVNSHPQAPIAQSSEWQSRFDNLWSNDKGKNAAVQSVDSGTGTGMVQPVASASKAAFSVTGPAAYASATVSLPASQGGLIRTSRYGFNVDNSSSAVSKATAEEAILEDRQFGSLPPVRLPQAPYLNERRMDFPRRTLPRHPFNKHRDRPIDVLSVDTASATLIDVPSDSKGTKVTINMSSMTAEKTVIVPHKRRFHHSPRQFSGSRGRGRGRGAHHHQHSPRGGAQSQAGP